MVPLATVSTPKEQDGTWIEHRARRDAHGRARHLRRRNAIERGLALGIPLALFGLWELVSSAGFIDNRIYPAPSELASTAWELAGDGRLGEDVLATLKRMLVGFVFGVLLGALLGLVLGLSRGARRALEPLLNALYVVPKLALLPIFLTIFGFGDMSKYVLVAVTVFFFVWIGVMEALETVPAGYIEAAKSLGVSRWELFRHVYVPAALPQFFVAMRVASGVALLIVIASEFVVGTDGLGYLIFNSRQLFLMSRSYVGIVVVALVGVCFTAMIVWLGRKLTPWEAHGR